VSAEDNDEDILKGVGNIAEESTDTEEETSSSALEQKELQLASQKLTAEQIAFVMETLSKKARFDVTPIKQLFYGMCSAFTKNPIPHNVNSKDAGAGKSYLLSHVAGHFHGRYVLRLTGMSDKAIFHRPGRMVIEKYNDESGELEVQPIVPLINKLELAKPKRENLLSCCRLLRYHKITICPETYWNIRHDATACACYRLLLYI
jgi:hypothetical protein